MHFFLGMFTALHSQTSVVWIILCLVPHAATRSLYSSRRFSRIIISFPSVTAATGATAFKILCPVVVVVDDSIVARSCCSSAQSSASPDREPSGFIIYCLFALDAWKIALYLCSILCCIIMKSVCFFFFFIKNIKSKRQTA